MSKSPPPPDFDENPEWTEDSFARAKPANEILSAEVVALLTKPTAKSPVPLGRPRGSNKEQVALRLDKEVVARFRSDGPGWQSRMNAALRKAAGL
jgi:uncharacterized protein (DUF4415 family)